MEHTIENNILKIDVGQNLEYRIRLDADTDLIGNLERAGLGTNNIEASLGAVLSEAKDLKLATYKKETGQAG